MAHSRFLQAVASFAALLVAYCGYAAMVVPLIEPTVRRAETTLAEPVVRESPTAKYRALIEPLFTAESWERGDDVHVIKTRGLYLLLRTITKEDGRLRLNPCTIIHLPEEKGGRTWIVQASKGAALEFDHPFDWQTGEMGELQAGYLPGRVLISGSPSYPGAEDRIEIDTQGVQFNTQTISTTEDVHFRFGQSFGSGRDLTIRLAPLADDKVRRLPSPAPTEVRQIELVQLHQAVIFPPPKKNLAGRGEPPVPLRVSAQGPVTIDIQGGAARVTRSVRVERRQPSGAADVVECDQLAAYFGRQPQPLPVAGSSTLPFPRMQFERLVASGQPARFVSQATELSGGGPSRWHRLASERLEYLVGDSAGPGQFQATGAGAYRTGTGPNAAELELQWSDHVEVLPHDDLVELTVLGNAVCRADGFGTVQSQAIWLQLVASRPLGQDPSAAVEWRSLQPRSVVAEDHVEVHSRQLDAYTDRLDIVMHPQDELQPPTKADGPELGAPQSTSEPLLAGNRRFEVRGERLQIDVASKGRRHEVEQVLLEGQVRCRDLPSDPREISVEVTGEQLRLSQPSRHGGLAVIVGRPATIQVQHMTLAGGNIHLDRGQNQLWIEGPGSAEAPLPDRFATAAGPGPAMADVNWERSMRFDGKTLLCQGSVLVQGPAQRVQANELAAMLTEPIDFGGVTAGGSHLGLHTVVATGDVALENQSTGDEGWLSVDRAQVARLELNCLAEEVQGTGPGWVETVRRGKTPTGLPAAGPVDRDANGLNYLRVNFEQGFDGGLARRELSFRGRVRSIMGPVHDWTDRLQVLPDGQLLPNTAVLGCQVLTVYQLPSNAASNRFELIAQGNTMVEGKTPTGQLFAAKGERLSYDQAKDMVILHGDGRADAQLWHQSQIDGPRNTVSAQRIRYSPGQNSYELGGVNMLDFSVGP